MIHRGLKVRMTTMIALLSFGTLTMAATGAMAQPPLRPRFHTRPVRTCSGPTVSEIPGPA
jgi:hypothetical protein